MKTKFVQYTKGYDAEGFVAPNVAYTNQTTYTNFINSGAEGAVGVFNAATGALITAAIANDVEFFVAIKRNGLVAPMTKIKKDINFKPQKIVGSAPTTQVTQIVITCGGNTECRSCNCCSDTLVNYALGILDTQTNDVLFESWNYELSGKAGRTVAQLLEAFRVSINDANGFVNKERGVVVTMSAVTAVVGATSDDPSTYTFTLTGTGAMQFKAFKVTAKGFCNAVITNTTLGSEGVNVLYDVVEADREFLQREGWGTETPGYPFTPEDFPSGTNFSKATGANLFTWFGLNEKRFEDSTVVERHYRPHLQVLYIPTGSALETSLSTVFGV